MTRRLASLAGLAGLLTLITIAGISAPARALDASSAAATSAPARVVLVGTSGVAWSDVTADRTPALWSLTAEAGAGTLAVHTIYRVTCPADGWLTVSSGRLAAAPRTDTTPGAAAAACGALPTVGASGAAPGAAPPAEWAGYLAQAAKDERDAQPGLLGHTLLAAGVTAQGIGPGAAVALANLNGAPTGRVEPTPDSPTALAAAVRAATDVASFVVVDIGPGGPDGTAPSAASLAELDARLAAVRDAVPADALLIVASLADAGTPNLQVLGITGTAPAGSEAPGTAYAGALLSSTSTRQPGMLQITDVPATVLAAFDVAQPEGFVGAVASPLPPGGTVEDRVQRLADYDAAAHGVADAIGPLVVIIGGTQLVWYLLIAVVLRRRQSLAPDARRRWLRAAQWAGLGFAALPVATYATNLIPWWRTGHPLGTLLLTMLAVAAAVTLAAISTPWRRSLLGPMGVVAAVTALSLAVIVLTGSRLLMSTLLGVQPLVSGRFYGLGNVPFALFATGSLLAAVVVADSLIRRDRRAVAVASVAVIGAVAILLDGLPGIGSDFGGPIAMVPAFTVLALTVAQVRISVRAVLGTIGVTVAVVTALALLDYLRPASERTHLGAFVAAVRAGEGPNVVGRKLSQNLTLLFDNPPGLLVPVIVVILILVVVRPRLLGLGSLTRVYERAPALRPGLLAMLVLLALGFAFNDSGTAVPAVAAALAMPLLIAVWAREQEFAETGGPTATASTSATGATGATDATDAIAPS